jgi:hypothetical protein
MLYKRGSVSLSARLYVHLCWEAFKVLFLERHIRHSKPSKAIIGLLMNRIPKSSHDHVSDPDMTLWHLTAEKCEIRLRYPHVVFSHRKGFGFGDMLMISGKVTINLHSSLS